MEYNRFFSISNIHARIDISHALGYKVRADPCLNFFPLLIERLSKSQASGCSEKLDVIGDRTFLGVRYRDRLFTTPLTGNVAFRSPTLGMCTTLRCGCKLFRGTFIRMNYMHPPYLSPQSGYFYVELIYKHQYTHLSPSEFVSFAPFDKNLDDISLKVLLTRVSLELPEEVNIGSIPIDITNIIPLECPNCLNAGIYGLSKESLDPVNHSWRLIVKETDIIDVKVIDKSSCTFMYWNENIDISDLSHLTTRPLVQNWASSLNFYYKCYERSELLQLPVVCFPLIALLDEHRGSVKGSSLMSSFVRIIGISPFRVNCLASLLLISLYHCSKEQDKIGLICLRHLFTSILRAASSLDLIDEIDNERNKAIILIDILHFCLDGVESTNVLGSCGNACWLCAEYQNLRFKSYQFKFDPFVRTDFVSIETVPYRNCYTNCRALKNHFLIHLAFSF